MRSARLILFALAFAVLLAARAASPADRADAPSAAALARQSPQQPVAPTIEVYSRETFVDIVVTDAKGQPVHGLQQSDFTILEDGKEMSPRSFEEHRTDVASAAIAPTKTNLPPNTFTNQNPTPPKTGPINILLLDSMNTPPGVQQIVQQQMLDFINKMRPGTRVAVMRLFTRLSILQGFTSDRELLKAAIASKENIARDSPLEDFIPPATSEWECDHAALRGQYTLPAMNQIARYLSGMPGRKNLIWFSGSFPLTMEVDGADCYDFTEDMKAATDVLAHAHVSIYPVDGRALDALAGASKARIGRQALEHLTMEAMAEQTGGKAAYATNDLADAVEQAIDTGSNFYSLTYVPPNPALDTRFRKITVKVNQPGLHLTYRDGYYAVDPSVDSRGKPIEKISPMQTALLRGSLDATEIPFRVRAVPASATEVSLPTNNQPNPKQMKPPYRRVSLSYLIDITHVGFTPSPDGNYRGDFELGVRVYNADGDEIVNAASKEVRPILPPAVYQSMLKGGAQAHLEIDVPAKGDYFLRIAVHDLTSDRVGAIEVPTSSIAPAITPAVASAP
jgi:VWFA-related protein